MSEQRPERPQDEHLSKGYDRMMERVKATIDAAGNQAVPTLQRNIEQAREKAVELGELTREEADKVAMYLQRDLQDAARYIGESGNDLRDWLKIDLELIEDRILNAMLGVADQTDLQMLQFQEELTEHATWHTGEVTAPGTLRCLGCGEQIHFHRTSHIPPCPACHGTAFQRPGAEK